MAKAIIQLGYKSYVVSVAEAAKIIETVADAERYETKYHSAPGATTHHIFYGKTGDSLDIKVISDSEYNLFKLAGEPEEN